MTVSDELNDEDRATYEKLSKLSGAAFDQAYAANMVSDHQHDIGDFEQEASPGKILQSVSLQNDRFQRFVNI